MKARTVWQRMSRILSREGEILQVSRFFFKSVTHFVLLFGADTWVVTPRMGWDLGRFQYHMARHLTGRLAWPSLNRRWENTLVEAARAEAGFEKIEICRIRSPSKLQRDQIWIYVSVYT